MANVRLSRQALNNVDEILNSVYEFTGFPISAQKLLNEFQKTLDFIGYMPTAAGRLRNDGHREAFCRGYRIVYQINGNDVEVLTIIHSSHLYPRPE